MPPKKQPQNAFFQFMSEYKKRAEANGTKFPNGWRDVAAACDGEWKNMTPLQKVPYETRAKNAKYHDRANEKYTSQGVPLSRIEKEQRRKQEFEDTMNKYIRNIVTAVNMDRLKTQRFYLIHVNWYCCYKHENGENDFFPAEYAVAEFSLKHGVENAYYEMINIDLPLGYAREAAEHSEETHQIPRNPPEGEKDFRAMYSRLINIMKPETVGGTLPPLYTIKSCTEVVPGLLRRMANASETPVEIFRVYSLETLFLHLRNAAAGEVDGCMGFPAVSLAEVELQKDYFAYAPDLPCPYHKGLDSAIIHCSLSVVKRWAFTICDHCCENLDIEMVPECHCPMNTDSKRFKDMNETIQSLHISESRPGSVLSMTGVSEKYRMILSARTYEEKQQRRDPTTPLQIIDHDKAPSASSITTAWNDNNNKPGAHASMAALLKRKRSKDTKEIGDTNMMLKMERPLRPPNLKSYAKYGAGSAQIPEMDEKNFPTVGRGTKLLKNVQNQQSACGRGHGSQMD